MRSLILLCACALVGCASVPHIVKETALTVAAFEGAQHIHVLAHELGHYEAMETQEDARNMRISTSMYSPRPYLSGSYDRLLLAASGGFFSGKVSYNWKLNEKINRWGEVRTRLAGVRTNERLYRLLNEELARGEMNGRFAHALAFANGIALPRYAFTDYRWWSNNGDLAMYSRLTLADRDELLTVAAVDLVGKLPSLWWHAKGMCGIEDPPPHLWRVGQFEIRPSAILTDYHLGWGIAITKTW